LSRNAFAAIQWAMSVPPILLDNGRVDDDAHHVLLVLATKAKPDGSGARPGLDWLARRSYRSVAAAQRALDALQGAGLISPAGDLNGTVVWQLAMNVVSHGRTVLDERQERARAANAERQRRHREKRAREAAGHVDVTPFDPVTEESRNGGEGRYVTGAKGVTRNGGEGRDVTGVSNAGNDPEGRYVTGGTPSQPQVAPGVTALGTALGTTQTHTTAPEGAGVGDAFTRFWAAYPKKVSKGGALTKFNAAVKRGVDPELIIAGAERYAAERAADPRPDAAQWTKYPTTWLTNGCWDDEPAPLRAVSGGYQPYRNPTDQSVYDGDLT
jgi:hypothetical protein